MAPRWSQDGPKPVKKGLTRNELQQELTRITLLGSGAPGALKEVLKDKAQAQAKGHGTRDNDRI